MLTLFLKLLQHAVFGIGGRGEGVGIGAVAAGDGSGGTEAIVKQKGVGSSQAMEDCRSHSIRTFNLQY
ncbi:hypothetical protein L195_g041757, partial [Trifolium pratense]